MTVFFLPIGIIICILFAANLAFIDYKLFLEKKEPDKIEERFNVVSVASPSAGEEATESGKQKVTDSCSPFSCVDLIRQATASVSQKTAGSTPKATTNGLREFYLPLGTGQTILDYWEDIPGAAIYIDSAKYGKIKKVTFEVSMRIPTANGRAYAQLFNETDKHPVWFSEVSMEGSSSQYLISAPITLEEGNKLYKVQMKTTLKYQSFLDSARVHIITE